MWKNFLWELWIGEFRKYRISFFNWEDGRFFWWEIFFFKWLFRPFRPVWYDVPRYLGQNYKRVTKCQILQCYSCEFFLRKLILKYDDYPMSFLPSLRIVLSQCTVSRQLQYWITELQLYQWRTIQSFNSRYKILYHGIFQVKDTPLYEKGDNRSFFNIQTLDSRDYFSPWVTWAFRLFMVLKDQKAKRDGLLSRPSWNWFALLKGVSYTAFYTYYLDSDNCVEIRS